MCQLNNGNNNSVTGIDLPVLELPPNKRLKLTEGAVGEIHRGERSENIAKFIQVWLVPAVQTESFVAAI